MLSEVLLPRKAADSSIMGWCHRTAIAFSMMQGQQSLTLYWRSFLGHGSDVVASAYT